MAEKHSQKENIIMMRNKALKGTLSEAGLKRIIDKIHYMRFVLTRYLEELVAQLILIA
jgi:hypothetical protein